MLSAQHLGMLYFLFLRISPRIIQLARNLGRSRAIQCSKTCQDGIQAEWLRAFTHVSLRPSEDGNSTAFLGIIFFEENFPLYPVRPVVVPVYNHCSVFSCHKFQYRTGFPFSGTSWDVLRELLLGSPAASLLRLNKPILLSLSSWVSCSSPDYPSTFPFNLSQFIDVSLTPKLGTVFSMWHKKC